MTITAKRFDFLDQETNVGVSDFIGINDSNIRNIDRSDAETVIDSLGTMLSPISEAFSTGSDNVEETIKEAFSGIDLEGFDVKDIFRESRSLVGVMANMNTMPNKLMDRFMDGMFPGNPGAKTLARNVFRTCSTSGNGFGNMRPFDVGIDCNGNSLAGGNGNCRPNGIAGLLDTLSNGAYGRLGNDINALINAIVAVAMGSYDANLCGGFKASITGLDGNKNAITRAGIMTMVGLSGKHNARANMEILNEVDTYDVNLQYPDATKTVLGQPNIEDNYYGTNGMEPFMTQFGQDTRYSNEIYQGMLDSADLLDPEWNRNEQGDLSLARVVDSDLDRVTSNRGFSSLSRNKLSSNELNIASLNNANSNQNDSLAIAYQSI